LRVVVVGTSAGGHLAALVAATRGALEPPELPPTSAPRRDSSVRGVVDIVGPTDLATFQSTDHPWAAPLTASFLGCPAPTDGQSGTCASDQLRRVGGDVRRPLRSPILLAYGARHAGRPRDQGEPLARIWRAHGGDPDSASYLVVETAATHSPADASGSPLDRVNGLAATGRADAAARPVVLYGDSLASESQTHFVAALRSSGMSDVRMRTFGGTALCDWLDEMRADAVDLRPSVAVIEFSGNAFTPCMQDSSGAPVRGDVYYAKYRDDAVEALRTSRRRTLRHLRRRTGEPARAEERRPTPGGSTPSTPSWRPSAAQSMPTPAPRSSPAVAGPPPSNVSRPALHRRNRRLHPDQRRRADGVHFCPQRRRRRRHRRLPRLVSGHRGEHRQRDHAGRLERNQALVGIDARDQETLNRAGDEGDVARGESGVDCDGRRERAANEPRTSRFTVLLPWIPNPPLRPRAQIGLYRTWNGWDNRVV
jgi:hypothetical protein